MRDHSMPRWALMWPTLLAIVCAPSGVSARQSQKLFLRQAEISLNSNLALRSAKKTIIHDCTGLNWTPSTGWSAQVQGKLKDQCDKWASSDSKCEKRSLNCITGAGGVGKDSTEIKPCLAEAGTKYSSSSIQLTISDMANFEDESSPACTTKYKLFKCSARTSKPADCSEITSKPIPINTQFKYNLPSKEESKPHFIFAQSVEVSGTNALCKTAASTTPTSSRVWQRVLTYAPLACTYEFQKAINKQNQMQCKSNGCAWGCKTDDGKDSFEPDTCDGSMAYSDIPDCECPRPFFLTFLYVYCPLMFLMYCGFAEGLKFFHFYKEHTEYTKPFYGAKEAASDLAKGIEGRVASATVQSGAVISTNEVTVEEVGPKTGKSSASAEVKVKDDAEAKTSATKGLVSGPCPQCEAVIQRPDGVDVWQCIKCGAELKLSKDGSEFVDTARDSLVSQRSGWESKLTGPVTFANSPQKQMSLYSIHVSQSKASSGALVVTAPEGTGHKYGDVDAIGMRARNNISSRVEDYPSRKFATVQHGGARHGARGVDGRDGANGNGGTIGHSGSSGGGNGGDGGNGHPGRNGTNGTPGQPGTPSKGLTLKASLSGSKDGSTITINGSSIQLGSSGRVLIDTHGGDGGHGGRGGDGGRGGPGGRGGNGGRGTPGRRGRNGSPGQDGEPGGDGGPGGNGGNGGNGGDGGHGGNAASGGDGANAGPIKLIVDDPRLLMLFEYDSRKGVGGTAGRAGRGGQGGSGGSGGMSGSGGSGGSGGNGGPKQGNDGRSGNSGRSGRTGRSGSSGTRGTSGQNGRDGSMASKGRDGAASTLSIEVKGKNGEKGTDRYNLVCHGYKVSDENGDGIFEPGSSLKIYDVEYGNEGSMTLPSGSTFSLADLTGGIKQTSPPIQNLDAVKPKGKAGKVQGGITCSLDGVQVSMNKPHVHVATVTSSFSMLGRRFWDGNITGSIRCMFPVRIVSYKPPEFLGPNEKGTIFIAVKNISSKPYGGGVSSDTVSLDVALNPQMMSVLPKPTSSDPGEDFLQKRYSWTVTGQGRARIDIHALQPGGTVVCIIPVNTLALTKKRLYHEFPIKTTLKLRNKPISQYTKDMRIVPVFNASQSYDALLVTCNKVKKEEFQAWDYMFQLTGLTYCPWDIHRYKRLTAAPDLSWVGRCCFVVAPCFEGVLTPEDFINQDIVTHFTKFSNTSLICVGADAVKYSHLMYSYDAPIGEEEARPSPIAACTYRCATPNFCGLWDPRFLVPKEDEIISGWTKKGLMLYTGALQSRDSSCRMHQAVFDKDKPRWALARSVFGYGMPHVEFHRSNIPASSELITVANSLNQEGKISSGGVPFTCVTKGDDILFMPRMDPIDLGKPFGACFFALLAGLPSWTIAKVLSRNDFVHKMTFKVPTRHKRIFGCNTCCDPKTESHVISFMDLCFSALEQKTSRSLLQPTFADQVTPAQGLEYFTNNNPQWHTPSDERVCKVAGRALGALYRARKGAVGKIQSLLCGAIQSNGRNLAILNASIGKIEAVVGDSVIAVAKDVSSRLETGEMLMNGTLKYPAAQPDVTSDAITLEQRMHFMKLNRRPAPTPLGKTIETMPTMHPIMIVTPKMLGVDDGSAVFVSDNKNGAAVDDSHAGSQSGTGSQGEIATAVPIPDEEAPSTRAVEQKMPEAPPVWEPSVFVPPDGSAVFVHPDKSPEPSATENPINDEKTGAAK